MTEEGSVSGMEAAEDASGMDASEEGGEAASSDAEGAAAGSMEAAKSIEGESKGVEAFSCT